MRGALPRRLVHPFATAAIVLAPVQSPGEGAEGGWAFNCGSNIAVSGADGLVYQADQPYTDGGAGYLGGFAHDITTDHLHIDGPEEELALYNLIRVDEPTYRFTVEPGLYELTLRMAERSANGPGSRVQDVWMDGELLIQELDVYALAGKLRSLDIRRTVVATGGSLDVVVAPHGSPRSFLGAIALRPMWPPSPLLNEVTDASVVSTYAGALLTWRPPPEDRQDGYLVTISDSQGQSLGELRRYQPWALAPAGADLRYEIAPTRSDGGTGDAVEIMGLAKRDTSESAIRWIELRIDAANRRRMERSLPDKIRVPATMVVDGVARSGRVNFRGTTSQSHPKKSYKFRIDEGPDLDGSDVVSLSANFRDGSLLRELGAHDLMLEAAVPCYTVKPVRLQVNGVYSGLRFQIEEPDIDYLDRIGFDSTGRCYKVERKIEVKDTVEEYIEGFVNTTADDWFRDDIIHFVEALFATPDERLEEWLLASLDVDLFIDWYAAVVTAGALDFAGHNFMLHRERVGGLWRILPWDLDNVMISASLPAIYATEEIPGPSGLHNGLVDRVLSVRSFERRYLERLSELLDGPFSSGHTTALLDARAGIQEDDARIDVEKRTRERFDLFLAEVDTVMAVMGDRESFLRASIDSLMPPQWVDLAINEVLLSDNDTAATALGAELHFRGLASIDVAGFHLSDDPYALEKWPLPNLMLETGEHLYVELSPGTPAEGWLWLSAADSAPIDSIDIGAFAGGDAIGRFPDGYGAIRVLENATPGATNSWSPAALLDVSRAGGDVVRRSDRFYVDLALSSTWREELGVRIEMDLEYEGGIRHAKSPILTVYPPILGPEEVWEHSQRLRVSTNETLYPPGRYDLVYSVIEGENDVLAIASASIFIDDGPAASLLINEICADNDGVIYDGYGEFEDWVELLNSGQDPIELEGYYLTDDFEDEPFDWPLPEATLMPNQSVLVWLDKDPEQGAFHADFKLDRDGEELALVLDADPDTVVIDRIVFGYQNSDWSFGRYPDARGSWELFDAPSPGSQNIDPVVP